MDHRNRGADDRAIFLVRADEPGTCKLRLLYFEPDARGAGDRRLRLERERARLARITLWTDSQLVAARRLYDRAGFGLAEAGQARFLGQEITSETWTLDLR